MNERAETIGRISEMLCRIQNTELLNRIYRFVKYIYIYREEVRG